MRNCGEFAMAWAACIVAGCGMGGPGGEIRVDPSEISAPATAESSTVLSLPTGRPFNIHLKNSTQSPGSLGRARGDSDATPDGQAFCLAEAANGGTAAGEFRLGQRVVTGDGQGWRAAIQLQFELRQSIQAPAQPAVKSLANLGLDMLVLDSHRRVLARSSLSLAPSDESTGSAIESHERSLAVAMKPGETYDIMLYGKVDAAAAEQQETVVRLDIRHLRMTIDFQPVTTRPSGEPPDTRPAG